MRETMKILTIIVTLTCFGCAAMKPSTPKISKGVIEEMKKTSLLGSKGLRVVGVPVHFHNGRCHLELEAENLPYRGVDWPYIIELRFFTSQSDGGESLAPEIAQRIMVKYKISLGVNEIYGEEYLADGWLRTASSMAKDFYYYPTPKGTVDKRSIILSKPNIVRLSFELIVAGGLDKEIMASVSIRTGGTK